MGAKKRSPSSRMDSAKQAVKATSSTSSSGKETSASTKKKRKKNELPNYVHMEPMTLSGIKTLPLAEVGTNKSKIHSEQPEGIQLEEISDYAVVLATQDVEVRFSEVKGCKGLFAKRSLRKGVSIPYTCKKIEREDYDARVNRGENGVYLVAVNGDAYDGDPKLFQNFGTRENGKIKHIANTCWCNYVNNPSHYESPNAWIFSEKKFDLRMFVGLPPPAYKLLPEYPRIHVWIVLQRTVKKDEEILVNYGWSDEFKAKYGIAQKRK